MQANKHDGAHISAPARPRGRRKAHALLLAAGLLALALISGVSLAWLIDATSAKNNSFQPSTAAVKVEESMDSNKTEKSNVYIKNTSDNPDLTCYIRAMVVVHWEREENGVTYIAPEAPVAGTGNDYSIEYGASTAWVKASDGFYYYTKPVAQGEQTELFIQSCKLLGTANPPAGGSSSASGYHLSVEIIASGIQALPTEAVTTAWSTGVSGVAVAEDGTVTLQIKTTTTEGTDGTEGSTTE